MQPQASYIVRDVNFEIPFNAKEHNTDRFHLTRRENAPRLVIRRGSTFRFTITFQRDYNRVDDVINLVFRLKGGTRHATRDSS